MDELQTPDIASALLRPILSFLPEALGREAGAARAELALPAARLGLEVLDAERRRLPFSQAVERSTEFPLMGQVYFGAENLLQWQVPPEVRQALGAILTQALEGEFESSRRLLFVIARRAHDPEAALCRFLLWAAVRLNLLIHTWDQPALQSVGVLDSIEDQTEETLRRLLSMEESCEPDCRPLHVLIAAALEEACAAAARLAGGAVNPMDAEQAEALKLVRTLQAPDAALFSPGRFTGPVGSRQILERFPQHHFSSVNGLEQRRSRLVRQLQQRRETPADRLIDLIRDFGERAQ